MRVEQFAAGARARDLRTGEVVVLKFGSSILRSPAGLPEAASELYRHARDGVRAVAVVSAFSGETDRLIAEAKSIAGGARGRQFARYVALGEERAAAALALACDAIGLDTEVLGPSDLRLMAGGPPEDAHPESVDADRLEAALARRDVVIVPGFAAVNASGDIVLLGRGGSDLTAVFLAAALSLDAATLLKDVDGVYDRDPALAGGDAHRFSAISWNEAANVAGRLVQPKAIHFAAARHTAIRVRRTGDDCATVIGAVETAPAAHRPPRPLRVAVAGLGIVGGGAALRLLDHDRYEVVGALVRDAVRPRDGALGALSRVETADALLALCPDIIVDALSEGSAGRALTNGALSGAVGVVSANKQAIAGDLERMSALARTNGVALRYSAAVGGGAPVIETVRRARAAGEVQRIDATLNGTVNFILSGLGRAAAFNDAVAAAQRAGFAEEDPSADLEGGDAAAKAAILIYEAFGVDFDPQRVSRQTLDADAYAWMKAQGGVWRQVTTIERKAARVSASVELVEVAADSALARASDEGNAVRIACAGGLFEARGRGAGRIPTVESVLADLDEVRRAIAGRA